MNPVEMQYRQNKRLTPEYLKSRIAAVEYETKETFGQKAMFCHFQLDNGYIVYGKKPSMAIDPANFNEEMGQKYSYQNTFDQLWELFAFAQLERERDLSQHEQLFDWREHIQIVRQETSHDPVMMRYRVFLTVKLTKTDQQFKVDFLEGSDPTEDFMKIIQENIGVDAVTPQRISFIAKVCHEANRAYCDSIGDNSQLSWEDSPEWKKASVINGVKFHLSGDHGPAVSHQNWFEQKKAEGWVYGPVKDAEKREHPCMVPYNHLPVEQRAKDFIFRSIVNSFK